MSVRNTLISLFLYVYRSQSVWISMISHWVLNTGCYCIGHLASNQLLGISISVGYQEV
jgi:membrane protease YdiL (CAAX protease family)